MAAPQNPPGLPSKSRGHSLFDRQAQLHAHDPDNPSTNTISDIPLPMPALRAVQSLVTTPVSSSNTTRRTLLATVESYTHSNDTGVRLISVHPRPEANYIKDTPPVSVPSPPPPVSTQLQETDFPLYETAPIDESDEPTRESVLLNESACGAIVEKAFDYLPSYDDDDDVVQYEDHEHDDEDSYTFNYHADEDYSSGTNDLDATPGFQTQQTDSGAHTLSSSGLDEINNSQERLDQEQQLEMPGVKHGVSGDDYSSDFDDEDDEVAPSSEVDHEQLREEQQHQIMLRQQQILRGIVQEWLRKEQSYYEQLRRMDEQFSLVQVASDIRKFIQTLIEQHKCVQQEIESLHDRQQQSGNLTHELIVAVQKLMDTLPIYRQYIKSNLAPTRKLLDKRASVAILPSEDLLSIPCKQFLQILSQVQDLYQTSLSFEYEDKESVNKLYELAQRFRGFGSVQDENINTVILKNEDVVTLSPRGSRERCRLILYPDAIVSCHLKAKLLTSPKYVVAWFIPMIDLAWSVPELPLDENTDTGVELKSQLKSVYKDLERAPKTNSGVSTRLSKNIRKQENEFQLLQSKLQLLLSNLSAPASPAATPVILFSSAYQRQEWIDSIDKAKQDLMQRNSAIPPEMPQTVPRLTDSSIQRRLDLIKSHLHDSHLNESPSNVQPSTLSGTYSGTLTITIHNIQGPALYNAGRQYQTLPTSSSMQKQMQRTYDFYVVVEIDSYNTFYPHAHTSKQTMQQSESVEFKGEEFHIELEHSLAFRLLVYRTELASKGNNSLQRPVCIGKFHHQIETALRDCKRNPNRMTSLESESGDSRLQIALHYSKREGTFKRQASKRTNAVFGKSIDKLLLTSAATVDGIPRLVVKCVELVERDGYQETGIYRVCCVASDLQKLRQEFDRNCRRAEEMLAQKNVHVAANLMKLFFRELPDPLFSSELYKQFIHAIQLTDADNQRVTLLQTVAALSAANRKILFYLLDHLIRVSSYSKINMMHLDNLAVVFGPTLMRPSKLTLANIYGNGAQSTSTDLDQMSSELQGSMHQCQVVLACLKLRQDHRLE